MWEQIPFLALWLWRCCASLTHVCIFWTTFGKFQSHFLCGKIRILPIIWENYRKYYRKPIYRHFSNYRQIIDIEIRLPEIIGDLKELSISISISKLPGKLSKNYCYWQKWLIADPYSLMVIRLLDQSLLRYCRRCIIWKAADALPDCTMLDPNSQLWLTMWICFTFNPVQWATSLKSLNQMEGGGTSVLEEFRCEWDDEGVFFYQVIKGSTFGTYPQHKHHQHLHKNHFR